MHPKFLISGRHKFYHSSLNFKSKIWNLTQEVTQNWVSLSVGESHDPSYAATRSFPGYCVTARSQLWNWVIADWKGQALITKHFFLFFPDTLSLSLSWCTFISFFVASFSSPCSFSDAAIDLLSSVPADLADSPVRKWIFQPTLDWLHLELGTLSGHDAFFSAHAGKKEMERGMRRRKNRERLTGFTVMRYMRL